MRKIIVTAYQDKVPVHVYSDFYGDTADIWDEVEKTSAKIEAVGMQAEVEVQYV